MEKLRRLLLLFKQDHISTKLSSLILSTDETKIAIPEQNFINLPTPGMLISGEASRINFIFKKHTPTKLLYGAFGR